MCARVGCFRNGIGARLLTLTPSAFGHIQHNNTSPRAYEAGMAAYNSGGVFHVYMQPGQHQDEKTRQNGQ
jgi:hypothetical protein